jgi:hypothetical protein
MTGNQLQVFIDASILLHSAHVHAKAVYIFYTGKLPPTTNNLWAQW